MKLMQIKITSVLLGAIAIATVPLLTRGYAIEDIACPDPFDGIELSDRQQSQLQQLEEQMEERYAEIASMSFSPEEEEKWNQLDALEEDIERQTAALISPQQEEQIEQLDRWAEEQYASLEEEYERRLQGILTPEQRQSIEALEQKGDEAFKSLFPELAEEEARFEALEEEFEHRAIQILTPEQGQQFQRNIAACDIE